jgi:alpha-tubulin suppressor-like RCC1 family protein
VGTANDWAFVSATTARCFVIKLDGSLWAWGNRSSGALGDGSTSISSQYAPVQVGTDRDWVSVSTGEDFTVGLKSDGSIWTWGSNSYGQLGDGSPTSTKRSSPARMGTDRDWVAVSAGGFHALALKADGGLWAWGSGNSGKLGDGTTTQRDTPVRVGTDTDWAIVTAGTNYSTALKTDGSLWVWGANAHGQLGDGTATNQLSPVQVGTDTDWVAVACSGCQSYGPHTMALKADGSLWGWGYGAGGCIGDGTVATMQSHRKTSPVQVSGASRDWTAVAAGHRSTVALKADGSLWAWGSNQEGQLGIGGTSDSQPVPVKLKETGWPK